MNNIKFKDESFTMSKTLRFISISHKTASVSKREEYHVSDREKNSLIELIQNTYPDIVGLFLLTTCNRTEIYIESSDTTALELLHFLVNYKERNLAIDKKLFDLSNSTEDTVRHLLEVSSGLSSSILGDAEIIHQIRKAHQLSITNQLQGSLLERTMQTVFKSHKRISNETEFRDGTTSVAYKSLKMVNSTFGKDYKQTKKILFIGAGDIVKQLFKYNSKFAFNDIYISNRTEKKAILLAKRYDCKVYPWDKVLENDFHGFDVIISAASNCHRLINNIVNENKKLLLIDLALPSNINKELIHRNNVTLYDLDTISVGLENTRERRNASIGKVDQIITEELLAFSLWYREAPLRVFLAKHKIIVNNKVKAYYKAKGIKEDSQEIRQSTNRVMRKLIKHTGDKLKADEIDAIVAEQIPH
ncbi:MAG: glutamyl-tRNA reductase [Eudoraea sp.]|uniref:glutamyl-tRNA reductase n=1 Tax=Eudoraea sp. TaxID=1979955 RepID=UPI003C70A990